MEQEARYLRERKITPTVFFRQTRDEWVAIARSIVRRYDIPPYVDVEDVVQQLFLVFVEKKLVDAWDPERGVPIARFVAWTAKAGAKDWVHRTRRAHRGHGTSPSRYDLNEARLADFAPNRSSTELGGFFDRLPTEVPDQERQTAACEILASLVDAAPDSRTRTVLKAMIVSFGDEREAAEAIRRNGEWSLDCEVARGSDADLAVQQGLRVVRGQEERAA